MRAIVPIPVKKAFIFFSVSILLFPLQSIANSEILNVSVDNAECKDTIDNDGDTFIDFPADPGCSSLNDNTENSLQCSDGVDNDGDTFIDFPADPGCSSATDNDETDVPVGGGGGDITPPSATLFSPDNNATSISTTTTLVIDFSEPIIVQSGNIRIKKLSDASTVLTISVNGPMVSFTSASEITVTPNVPLAEGTSYYIEIDGGIVNDGAGNAFGGISGSSTWRFSTAADVTPPQISNLSATPGISSTGLSWTTNESAISSFFWGTTTDYLTGSGAEVFYSTNHTTIISGLVPQTLYYFAVEARDAVGNKSTATGSFTTLSVADSVPPANPSNFTATPQINSIAISWTNPTDPDFEAVKIMRSTSGYPQTPNDGTLVYQGNAEEAFDASISEDVRYYYTIFARDTSLNYSSGAIASALVSSIPIVTPPIEPPPPSPPGESPTSTPPIILPPPPQLGTSTPPIVVPPFSLLFGDFDFYSLGKKIIPDNNEVIIGEKNELQILLNPTKAPSGGKLFIVSLRDPNTGKISSYLLTKHKTGEGYKTTVSPLAPGKYSVNIKIFDEYNTALVDVNGAINVSPPTFSLPSLTSFLPVGITKKLNPGIEAVSPVAVPIGVAIGVSQAVVLAANVGSFFDLYLLFLKSIGLLTGLFRKRKPEPWGVVYDSVTKQPIDPAYVVVESMDRGEKKSAITDLDGRYGFLLSPGQYSLIANKTHYKFPSENLIGKTHDELYGDLYFGTPFAFKENQILRYNVPLDPVGFDWNEFAKNKDKIFSLYSRRQKLRVWLFNIFFYVGLVIAVYGTMLHPTKFNAAFLVIYGAIIIFQAIWKRGHHVTNLINKATGQPIPFALISVNFSGMSTLVRKVVTDQLGRFYLLVSPGTYDITVQEKQPDGSYALVHTMNNVKMKKGVLTEDIVVGE